MQWNGGLTKVSEVEISRKDVESAIMAMLSGDAGGSNQLPNSGIYDTYNPLFIWQPNNSLVIRFIGKDIQPAPKPEHDLPMAVER